MDTKIVMMRLADIKPYAKNPRKNDQAVDAVANSIREFGFKVPIVIDAKHEIVAGDTRYKAAQKLGMDEVPCIIADDLTPAQVKAFRLADNKVGELAGWDFDALQIELDNISIDMDQFGFGEISFPEEGEHEIERSEAKIDDKLCVIVDCADEAELQRTYEQLVEEGYNCRVSTL